MTIELKNVGRQYRREWIFRNLDFSFQENTRTAIIGPNGSGKSTLMKVISGHLSPSKGQVIYWENEGEKADYDLVYQKIAYAAPYIELIEEMTMREHLRFHQTFKPFLKNIDETAILDILSLGNAADREIRFFSSGMKQRLKLASSILSDTPILLLDEPSTNLDQQGIQWYLNLLENFAEGRVCIIASNDAVDIEACSGAVPILEHK